jgi:hypothetical protein
MSKRALNERQKLFLEHLFGDEARGDAAKAKLLAGFSPDYSTSTLIESMKEDIVEATRTFLSRNGPKAAIAMVGAVDNPIQLGIKEKIVAAKDILDRIGVTKTERVEVSGPGIFYLPSKVPTTLVEDEEDAEDS